MPTSIMLVSRNISEEELTNLAPFSVLWPQYLPKGYTRGQIIELSENETSSSGSGIFILEFTNYEGNDLFIQQSKHMMPDYRNKSEIGSINIMNTDISVFKDGLLNFAFFEYGEVHVELVFQGISLKDVEDIASLLSV